MIYIILIILLLPILAFIGMKVGKKKHAEIIEKKKIEEEIITQKVEKIEETYNTSYKELYDYLNHGLLDKNHYFSYSEAAKFKDQCSDVLRDLIYVKQTKGFKAFTNCEEIQKFYEQIIDIDTLRINHNKEYQSEELAFNKEFFDSVLSYPLDVQQRDSIVNQEDNCLVISSAGSGKTSTMVGKLMYLVTVKHIAPSRILTITYTHKAADELTQRLLGTGLTCITFHKLAMNIVKKVEGEAPNIAAENEFLKVFYDLLNTSEYRSSVLNYLTDYKSLVKNEHEYRTGEEYYNDRKKYGVVALYPDMDGKLIATKSEEEKKICHYLTELGVKFRYEERYFIDTMTEDFRQYKPDFTIYYKDKDGNNKVLYLEHYGINAAGNVPEWFGAGSPGGWSEANVKYHEGMAWKKKIHADNGTTLINTTSADFHQGIVKFKLRDMLLSHGVVLDPPSKDELLDRIINRHKSLENALLQMTQGFLTLTKANGHTIDDIYAKVERINNKRDMFVIDKIMRPLWNAYEEELWTNNKVDFTDVITKATKYCQEGKWNQKYEYVLVDEFQDISIDRYHLLQAIRTEVPKTKLYCVGDDWQSIYRFSGSDMSLFSRFSDYFGHTDECKIETTYRFGNPLIERSSNFVVANPMQKHKNVRPRPVNPPTTKLSFRSYKDEKDLDSLMERMIERVPEDKSAYIISRYSYDVKDLVNSRRNVTTDPKDGSVFLQYGKRKVKFMTIHSSKGLEADYVFMINCNSGLYGFPSLISDDPIMDHVLSEAEKYEYAEERRVFYVGITRAKEHTVVLYDESRPSPFVVEMDDSIAIPVGEKCPLCGVGHKILKYEGWTKQRTPYRVWGCDNQSARCQYFEREFINHKRDGYVELTGKKFKNSTSAKRV